MQWWLSKSILFSENQRKWNLSLESGPLLQVWTSREGASSDSGQVYDAGWRNFWCLHVYWNRHPLLAAAGESASNQTSKTPAWHLQCCVPGRPWFPETSTRSLEDVCMCGSAWVNEECCWCSWFEELAVPGSRLVQSRKKSSLFDKWPGRHVFL